MLAITYGLGLQPIAHRPDLACKVISSSLQGWDGSSDLVAGELVVWGVMARLETVPHLQN